MSTISSNMQKLIGHFYKCLRLLWNIANIIRKFYKCLRFLWILKSLNENFINVYEFYKFWTTYAKILEMCAISMKDWKIYQNSINVCDFCKSVGFLLKNLISDIFSQTIINKSRKIREKSSKLRFRHISTQVENEHMGHPMRFSEHCMFKAAANPGTSVAASACFASACAKAQRHASEPAAAFQFVWTETRIECQSLVMLRNLWSLRSKNCPKMLEIHIFTCSDKSL